MQSESLDSPALAAEIDARHRPLPHLHREVSVSGEATKHGCALRRRVAQLIDAVEARSSPPACGLHDVGLNSLSKPTCTAHRAAVIIGTRRRCA